MNKGICEVLAKHHNGLAAMAQQHGCSVEELVQDTVSSMQLQVSSPTTLGYVSTMGLIKQNYKGEVKVQLAPHTLCVKHDAFEYTPVANATLGHRHPVKVSCNTYQGIQDLLGCNSSAFWKEVHEQFEVNPDALIVFTSFGTMALYYTGSYWDTVVGINPEAIID